LLYVATRVAVRRGSASSRNAGAFALTPTA
jgi:hypothetical protein